MDEKTLGVGALLVVLAAFFGWLVARYTPFWLWRRAQRAGLELDRWELMRLPVRGLDQRAVLHVLIALAEAGVEVPPVEEVLDYVRDGRDPGAAARGMALAKEKGRKLPFHAAAALAFNRIDPEQAVRAWLEDPAGPEGRVLPQLRETLLRIPPRRPDLPEKVPKWTWIPLFPGSREAPPRFPDPATVALPQPRMRLRGPGCLVSGLSLLGLLVTALGLFACAGTLVVHLQGKPLIPGIVPGVLGATLAGALFAYGLDGGLVLDFEGRRVDSFLRFLGFGWRRRLLDIEDVHHLQIMERKYEFYSRRRGKVVGSVVLFRLEMASTVGPNLQVGNEFPSAAACSVWGIELAHQLGLRFQREEPKKRKDGPTVQSMPRGRPR